MNDKLSIRRGEIYYIIKSDTLGSEMETGRPAIVVSNDDNNKFSNTIEVVYLTTQPKKELPTHVVITATNRTSTVLCEQITTVDIMRVGTYVATCTPGEMRKVDAALAASLNLKSINTSEPTIMENYDAEYVDTVGDALVKLEAERDIYKNLYESLLSKITGGKI